MNKRQRVVLYNPKADFYTMPLALLAVGSYLDPKKHQVVIVDGRLESSAVEKLLLLAEDALCLGVTVLTGSPIRDALTVSRAVKCGYPNLPVVWGGWHASLFARKCLREESSIDATVQGQGEETFGEIISKLPDLSVIRGCTCRRNGDIIQNPGRPFRDINCFPRHNYELIPVEEYFRLKKCRQLDYISSQGCHFRCAFCADPTVYERKWVGLEPQRVGEEIAYLWKKYAFEDLNFQDETFFTRNARVVAIAEEFLRRDLKITWAGTLRADQGVRLSEEAFKKCKESGLRRVMIGVESGSQNMLNWMAKDITLEQVFETAEKCVRYKIGAIFPFIVGFPNEPGESVDETLKVAHKLRSMSPNFEIAIFFYLPYPGSPLTSTVEKAGFPLPKTLDEWAEFDFMRSHGAWVDKAKLRRVERFKFYERYAWSHPSPLRWPVQKLAQWRCRQLIA